jgi:hypothetical protein
MVAGVDGAKTADQATVQGTLWHLVCRVPLGRVSHGGERRARAAFSEAVSQHTVVTAEVLRLVPGTVVVSGLKGVQQLAGGRGRGVGHQGTRVAVTAQRERGQAARQSVGQPDVRGTR